MVPCAPQPSLWALLTGPWTPPSRSASCPLILGSWNSSANLRGSIIHMRVSPQIPTPTLISSHRLATSSWVPHKIPQALYPELTHLCPHPSPLWAPPKPSFSTDLSCHLPSPELSALPPPHSLALPQGLCTAPLPQSAHPISSPRSDSPLLTPVLHPNSPPPAHLPNTISHLFPHLFT